MFAAPGDSSELFQRDSANLNEELTLTEGVVSLLSASTHCAVADYHGSKLYKFVIGHLPD